MFTVETTEHVVETGAKVSADMGKKRLEDSIPVVEIRGEGKPMSAAQIRELEEAANGGPLDIKVYLLKFVESSLLQKLSFKRHVKGSKNES